MMMKIAIAKDGFIDTKDTPNFTGKTTFLECLQEVLNFEEKDLMEFDGNTCQFVNSYNPTNSIFIYTNQQGTFLYTITDATPRVHKNNFIWDCKCYKMEDVAQINDILGNNKVAQAIIFKNIAPSGMIFDTTGVNNKLFKKDTPDYIVEEKPNFKTQEIFKHNINLDYWCFKLKFLTCPDANNPPFNTLVTKEEDGSWNFFFPMYMGAPTKTTSDLFPLGTPTTKIKYGSDIYTMKDIITKYSTNLKSVEIIPFFPYTADIMGGTLTLTPSGDTLEITSISGATFTDCGIFFPYGRTTKRSVYNGLNFQKTGFAKMCLLGGVRGKLSLPLGDIPINFNSFKLSTYNQTNNLEFYIKSEGWKIDGLFEVDAPPHYINFFTNETGQLLIQNMTTNAQELREINRNYDNERSQMGISRASDLISGLVSNAFSGNIGGIIGTIGSQALGTYTDLAKAELNYNKSIESYNDKIKTQSLLAQMTGKTINGNIGFSDIIINFAKNSFLFVFELNYSLKCKYDSVNNKYYYYILPQDDYDYSTQYLINKDNTTNKYCMVLNRSSDININYDYNTLGEFMAGLFGYGTTINDYLYYSDDIGLNYNITFKLENLPSTMPTQYGTISESLKQTLILNFPIRHKKKTFIN